MFVNMNINMFESVSVDESIRGPTEIILKCWFDAQDPFRIILKMLNSFVETMTYILGFLGSITFI